MEQTTNSPSPKLPLSKKNKILPYSVDIEGGKSIPGNKFNETSTRGGIPDFIRCIWSIRVLVIVSFVLTVVVSALSIWFIVFFSAQTSIFEGSRNNRETIVSNIRDFITVLLKQGPSSSITLGRMFRNDLGTGSEALIELTSEERAKNMIADLFQSYPDVSQLVYANEKGDLIGMELRDGELLLGITTNRTLEYFRLDPDTMARGEKTPERVPNYDPRDRGWYMLAKTFRRRMWTPITVILVREPMLSLFFLTPLYNYTSDFVGVGLFSIELTFVSSYLQRINVGNEGRLFIIERTGNLVGTNKGLVYSMQEGSNIPNRLNATHHEDHVVRESTMYLFQQFGSLSNLNERETFQVYSASDTFLVDTVIINDSFGIDWIVVSALSSSELMGRVNTANIIASVVSASALVLAVLFSLFLGIVITRPLSNISSQMKKIANMEFKDGEKKGLSTLFEFVQMERSLRQMKTGLTNFRRYVPDDLVRQLLKSGIDVSLGLKPTELTILFMDIVDFTKMSESCEPEMLIEVMQEFFTMANEIIKKRDGTIDKYIGDCIMSFWGAPVPVTDQEVKAIEAAMEINNALDELNSKWNSKNFPQIKVRTGINTARVLVGNVGSPARMNFTALGDGVNIASRLESLNNVYKTKIMIGEKTMENPIVPLRFGCRWVDRVYLKGKDKPIDVYEVMGYRDQMTNQQIEDIELHEKARVLLQRGDMEGLIELCKQLIRNNESNESAQQILSRASSGSLIRRMNEK